MSNPTKVSIGAATVPIITRKAHITTNEIGKMIGNCLKKKENKNKVRANLE